MQTRGGGLKEDVGERSAWALGEESLRLREEIQVVLPQRGHLRVEASQVLPAEKEFVLLVRDDASTPVLPGSPSAFFRLCSIPFSGGLPREILQMDPEVLAAIPGNSRAVFAASKEDRAFLLGSALWWASGNWSFEPRGAIHSEVAKDVMPLSAAMTSKGLYLAYTSAGHEVAEVVQLHRPGHFRRSFGELGSDLLRLHRIGDRVLATDLFRVIFVQEEGRSYEKDLSSYFTGEYLGRELVQPGLDDSLLISNGKHLLRVNAQTLEVIAEGRLPELSIALWETQDGISTVSMDEILGMVRIRRYGV